MMSRTMQDGTVCPELEESVTLSITTKCPEKYTLIDNETGQMYKGNNSLENGKQWLLINENSPNTSSEIKEILDAVEELLKR